MPPFLIKVPNQKEREEYAQKIRNHFSDLMLQSAFNRMSPQQLDDLKASINNPQKLEEKIEEYSSLIPGLAEDIETRLQKEFDVMKESLATI